MVRFVRRLGVLVLDHLANACHEVHHHLACFSILEIDARIIHAHCVDATHDEHAVVYHDAVAESHAADGARVRVCSPLSFLEKRYVRYSSNGVGEDFGTWLRTGFIAPFGGVQHFRDSATAARKGRQLWLVAGRSTLCALPSSSLEGGPTSRR